MRTSTKTEDRMAKPTAVDMQIDSLNIGKKSFLLRVYCAVWVEHAVPHALSRPIVVLSCKKNSPCVVG